MRQTRAGPAWVLSPQIRLLRGFLVGRPKPEDLAPAQVAGGEDGIGKRSDSAAATGRRGDEAAALDVRDDFRGGI